MWSEITGHFIPPLLKDPTDLSLFLTELALMQLAEAELFTVGCPTSPDISDTLIIITGQEYTSTSGDTLITDSIPTCPPPTITVPLSDITITP